MSGIIIAKIEGRVSKYVVERLREVSRQFFDDKIAMLIQHDDLYISPKIQFEISDLGSINSNHIQNIVDALFIRNKGKGIGDTSVSLSFKQEEFTLPNDYKKCIKFLS